MSSGFFCDDLFIDFSQDLFTNRFSRVSKVVYASVAPSGKTISNKLLFVIIAGRMDRKGYLPKFG